MTTPSSDQLAIHSSWHRLALAVASGVMLGISFPPSPVHSFAYVGLIPLLLLLETLDTTWHKLKYSYVAFFILHALTLYWIGGFVVGKDPWMMIAGGAVLLIHPLFYVFVIYLFVHVRKRLGLIAALVFFPLAWIAYEYSHSLSEVSFPWITLGNSQAYDLRRIQIAEFTSTYGISYLVLCFNGLGFVLISNLATGRWGFRSRPSVIALGVLLAIYFLPWLYGSIVMKTYVAESEPGTLSVGIVQPNIDPWEKWSSSGASPWAYYERQLENFVGETKTLARNRLDLIVWPETAIPFRILLPGNQMYLHWLRQNLDSTGSAVLTGLPYTVFYDSAHAPVTASHDPVRKKYFDDFNSTALFVPGREVVPVYKKIVLVPFAERIPYADVFRFLIEPLKWNVGIGMWGKGTDTTLFGLPTAGKSETKFASMICYESVYPNFVRTFVQRGAQFLVIVTNDSWWGNTPGAYQHASLASIRAIENRRWIVRAANGGISGFIDPAGGFHNETRLYTTAAFHGTIEPRAELTFYARHGDIFAQVCALCAAVILVLTFLPQRKPKNSDERIDH
ncbi:MAG: apolipoprotein N-acyltransferase [Ignavibacteriales bacterium]|nr:apolipoprotein N-acyltransferase [Ignavibacteriales bacterium]